MPLTPDKVEQINGVTVKTYLLTQHNPKRIAMPTVGMTSPLGVTIHNTGAINVASNTTPAEQYTRATMNGNMNTVRVHFYVDDTCAWQNLPLTLSGWHAADGSGNGNRRTISFEVIGNSAKAEANAVKLAAYFLKKYGKTVDNGLFTHTHWLNVRDGKKGTIDYLNTARNSYKMCPIYILPHWQTFKTNVKNELARLGGNTAAVATTPVVTQAPVNNVTPVLFRIRKSWNDEKSQIGAYSSLENAKKAWKEGYFIYDSNGKQVYPENSNVIVPAQDINVTYRVFARKRWLPEVNNLEDYAGIKGYPISCVAIKSNKGTLRYRVHQQGSKWMNWITKYDISDLIKGCAGIPNIKIDAIQIELKDLDGYDVRYRVANQGRDYLPWVIGTSDYAGIFGKTFDRLQIEIVKK